MMEEEEETDTDGKNLGGGKRKEEDKKQTASTYQNKTGSTFKIKRLFKEEKEKNKRIKKPQEKKKLKEPEEREEKDFNRKWSPSAVCCFLLSAARHPLTSSTTGAGPTTGRHQCSRPPGPRRAGRQTDASAGCLTENRLVQQSVRGAAAGPRPEGPDGDAADWERELLLLLGQKTSRRRLTGC